MNNTSWDHPATVGFLAMRVKGMGANPLCYADAVKEGVVQGGTIERLTTRPITRSDNHWKTYRCEVCKKTFGEIEGAT